MREFAYAGDVAKEIVSLLSEKGMIVQNLSAGQVLSPEDMAKNIAELVGFRGKIVFAVGEEPDRYLDKGSGGKHTPLEEALRDTIQDFLSKSER